MLICGVSISNYILFQTPLIKCAHNFNLNRVSRLNERICVNLVSAPAPFSMWPRSVRLTPYPRNDDTNISEGDKRVQKRSLDQLPTSVAAAPTYSVSQFARYFKSKINADGLGHIVQIPRNGVNMVASPDMTRNKVNFKETNEKRLKVPSASETELF